MPLSSWGIHLHASLLLRDSIAILRCLIPLMLLLSIHSSFLSNRGVWNNLTYISHAVRSSLFVHSASPNMSWSRDAPPCLTSRRLPKQLSFLVLLDHLLLRDSIYVATTPKDCVTIPCTAAQGRALCFATEHNFFHILCCLLSKIAFYLLKRYCL